MTQYYSRWIEPLLETMCQESPIVVLTGPRQVGKSTLLKQKLGNRYKLFNLDNFDVLNQIERDPLALLTSFNRIIIDEAQRAPDCFTTVKLLVDNHPNKRFVLSGSANLMLMQKISESLAGRAEFIHLMPMTQGELQQSNPSAWFIKLLKTGIFEPPVDKNKLFSKPYQATWRGGMPVCLQRTESESLVRWREGFIESYLERDLRQLSSIDSLADFKALMKLASLRNAQILNQSEIARDAALSQPTAHRYLNLLQTSEWTYILPAYAVNRSLRMVKSPKLHWFDTGIAAHLQGFYSPSTVRESREFGGLWETWVLEQIRPLCQLMTPKAELYFWRIRSGAEIDAVIQRGKILIAIEIKSKPHVNYSDTTGLQLFIQNHPGCHCGLLFYPGSKLEQMTDKIWAVPVSYLT